MRDPFLLTFALLALFLTACTAPSGQSDTDTPEFISVSPADFSWPDTSAYFKATGTEPFWGVKITPQTVTFSEPGDEGIRKLVFPRTDPVRAQHANAMLYNLQSPSGLLQVGILRRTCVNAMSGDSFPYLVNVTIQRQTDSESVRLAGCGEYITDYRLHDIWVLEKMRGVNVSTGDFQKELPYVEINTNAGTFMGYAGCNQMSGRIISEYNVLHFTNIISTLKACSEGNKEDAFLQALKASTQYAIGNNRLFLFGGEGETLTFKHVD